MFYLPTEYHDYIYLCDISDNYVALTKNHHIYGESGDLATINCIYQYFTPSIYTIEGTYSSYETETFSDVSSQFSDDIFDRADFPIIFVCNFLTCVIFVFIINQLTKIVKKGGVFGSS